MKETVIFLEARTHPLAGSGIGIIGISLRERGHYAEGFVILPKAEDGYRHEAFHFEVATRLELPEVEALLTAHIRMWLQAMLDEHLLRWQESHPTLPLVPPYTLHELGDPAAARLSLLAAFGPETIDRIRKEARTRALQEWAASVFDIAGYFTPLK